MAKNKKSFQLYTEWIESFEILSNEEAGKLIKHVFRYVNDLNPDTPDRLTELSFTPIKQQLKRDLKKWENIAERNKINGSKGGRPKTQENPVGYLGTQKNPKEPKKPVKVEVEVKVKENNIIDRFENLWNAYDKKIGKKEALKAYKKLTDSERNKILPSVISKYKLCFPDKQFRKNLSSWLNQKSWEDEYELTRDQELTIYQQQQKERLKNEKL